MSQPQDMVVEIDTSELEKRLKGNMTAELKPYFEQYIKKLKDNNWKEPSKGGKGVVEAFMPADRKAQIIEKFKNAGSAGRIQEQWTVVLPKYRVSEIAAHLRDFIYVTDVIKGQQGDVVNLASNA